MVQIISVTKLRDNAFDYIRKVKTNKNPIVIVQDSTPAAVIYPYDEILQTEDKDKAFREEFQKLLNQGKALSDKYLKSKKISKKLTEDETYALIKND